MLFCRKTDDTVWNPPLSKRTPTFQLTPLFLSNFFMIPLFVQILKTRNPPNFRGGGGNYENTISGNLTATMSDHLPQFITLPNIFSNPPSNKSNTYERDWSNFVHENFILDYFSVD